VWYALPEKAIENMTLLTISVFLLVALLFLQTLILGITSYHLRSQLSFLDKTLHMLAQKSSQGLRLADEALSSIEQCTPKLPDIEAQIAEELESYANKAKEADEILGRKVDLLRYRSRESESTLEGMLDAVSEQVYTLQKVALFPSLRLATIVRSGIDLLKRAAARKGPSSATPEADSEGFV